MSHEDYLAGKTRPAAPWRSVTPWGIRGLASDSQNSRNPQNKLIPLQRQNQSSRAAGERDKSVMPIELPGLFVFGVDDQCADSKFGASGAIDCIPQQGGSEFAAMAVRRNCQSSQTRDRNRRIPRKTFCQRCRHLRKGDTGGGERVESRDVACGGLARYKTRG